MGPVAVEGAVVVAVEGAVEEVVAVDSALGCPHHHYFRRYRPRQKRSNLRLVKFLLLLARYVLRTWIAEYGPLSTNNCTHTL